MTEPSHKREFPDQLWLVRYDPEIDPAPTFSEQRAEKAVADGHEVASYIRGEPPRTPVERVMSLLGKIDERYEERELEAFERAWCQQPREERKARLRLVQELSVQLFEIRRVSNFGTAMGDMAIEAVIEGNWDTIEQMLPDFTFEDHPEMQERFAKLWEPFLEPLRKEMIRRSTH